MTWIDNLTREEVEAWAELIDRTARFVARDFPGVSADDVYQQVWVDILGMKKGLDIDRPGTAKILSRYATRYALKERLTYLYFHTDYHYRPGDIRAILETALDSDEVRHRHVPGDAHSWFFDAMDGVDIRVDIILAFEQLPLSYQEAIERRYVHNLSSADPTERKTLSRAIERMANILNRNLPHRGRRARTNLSSLETIRNQEEQ